MIRVFATMACLVMMVGCTPTTEDATTTTVAEPVTTVPSTTESPASFGLDASVGSETTTNTTNNTKTSAPASVKDNNTPIVVDEVVVTPKASTVTK